MAESAVFNLASKILSTIASPIFEKAYEKGLLIWEARDELVKLQVTIETIQAVLLDAEKKQQGSVAVKNWIKRLKGVLYDADDLFDQVATDDMIKQQIMKGNANLFSKKVQVSCSRLNPIVSRNSIAKKVKTIRKNLLEISADMSQFEFVRCQNEEPTFGIRRGQDPGCYVDAKAVIGRDKDREALLELLFNELDDAKPDVPIDYSHFQRRQWPSTVFCPSTSPLAFLRHLEIYECCSLKSLHLTSPQLQTVLIYKCNQLTSFELFEAPSLGLIQIKIMYCKQLKTLHIASPLNALEKLTIIHCPELESWELQDNTWLHLDWDSLSNLDLLRVDRLPPPEKLPHCLRHRQALGLLRIIQVMGNSDSERRMPQTEHSSKLEA